MGGRDADGTEAPLAGGAKRVPRFARARAAVEAGDLPALRALLADDAELARRRDEGGTLLHHATGMPTLRWPDEAPAIVALLVEAGADPDAGEAPDGSGETPLIHAVSVNNVPVAARLLDLGADPERTGRYAQEIDTALGYALFFAPDPRLRRFAEDAPALLERRGARVLLPHAAALGRTDRLRDELPGAPERVSAQALVFAALHGRDRAVRACLDAGADPSARLPFFHETYTALHAAAGQGHAGTVDLLLGAGADPGVDDGRFGSTPLGWARHLGHDEVVGILERARGEAG